LCVSHKTNKYRLIGRNITKWEMIFVQLFCDNFFTTFSLILTLSFYSLFLFLSPLFLTEKKLSPKVVSNDCSNITTLTKYMQGSEYKLRIPHFSTFIMCELQSLDYLTKTNTGANFISKHIFFFLKILMEYHQIWLDSLKSLENLN